MKSKTNYERLGDNVLRLKTGPETYSELEIGRALNHLSNARYHLIRHAELPGVKEFIAALRFLERNLKELPVQPGPHSE